jgi:hypothetical protein
MYIVKNIIVKEVIEHMASFKKIKQNGEIISIATHENLIYDSNGRSISNKYASTEDLNNIDLTSLATKEELNNLNLDDYATKENLSNLNLDNYVTKEEIENAITEATQAKQGLVDALMALGVTDVSNNNNWSTLINKVSEGKYAPYAAWKVEAVSGAQYGFELNSNGFYESQNKGISDSYALCKVIIDNPNGRLVYVDCINYGEDEWDYGILSNINTTLTLSSTADSSNVKHAFCGSEFELESIQTVYYGAVSGYIYIKYKKDGSGNYNNDTLQFKVRFV